MQCTVCILNDPAFLPVARAAAARTARTAGFPDEEAERIALGVEEAILRIIDHAFLPGAEETITLSCTVSDEALEIRIVEHGIPFDPAVEAAPLPLCAAVMDRISFANLGWGGKETMLAKHLDPARAPHAGRTTLPEPPSAPATIRPTAPDEAVAISRCAYRGYGYSYGYEKVYHPEVLKSLIRTGQLLSFVALDGDAVIGHAGLLFYDDPGVAEIALGFVNPAYRGRRVFSDLMATVLAEAERRHLAGVSGQAVCTHLYSQRSALTFGMGECALLLSRYTPLRFTGIADGNRLRESILAVFRYLAPTAFPTLYPPAHHAGMIRAIYRNLGVVPPFGTGGASSGLPDLSDLATTVEADYGTAQIRVRAFGRDLIPRLRHDLARLRADRLESVYLHLPLTDFRTAAATAAVEDLGFFFAGLSATSTGDDFLTLQYLNNRIIDYDTVLVASEFGSRLKDYVRERDPWQEFA
jgi:anti-sigma regulatory factor (Ser/Thr protein kinase)